MRKAQRAGLLRLLHSQRTLLFAAMVKPETWPAVKDRMETCRADYVAIQRRVKVNPCWLVFSPQAVPDDSVRRVYLVTSLALVNPLLKVRATVEASEAWAREIGQGQIEP